MLFRDVKFGNNIKEKTIETPYSENFAGRILRQCNQKLSKGRLKVPQTDFLYLLLS